ncbi:alpha/beta hydrolase fold domain-containing protein [Agromyces aurantiacus]|uniref:Alpha/beta hydrolase fold domain-containing protein n=1 Tax=Agromyces aurantiacus TaxID=165814 RepID=A0ABV9R1M2_9MICO|nr:alpha/beta hydrolase [Agromyces aurantiacus]MBM7506043.1 acetyl esterase/lipase [Agromyces aurantiacus]
MTTTRPSGGLGGRRRRSARIALAVTAALAIVGAVSAFHQPLRELDPNAEQASSEVAGTEVIGIRTFEPPAGLRIHADLEYGVADDGTLLTLDLCRPEADDAIDDALPVVLSVHGGSWARGDKANSDWRAVCLWLASEGFVAASVNYRLVPEARYPAQIEDVATAVAWLREPGQVERYGIDPTRIAAFGGSAGGHLASLLGTLGDGPLDAGSRVAAVVELSGPVGLGRAELDADGASEWLRGIVGQFLGCDPGAADADCPQAIEASATAHVDPSDPPFFIGHAEAEVVPVGQSERLAATLEASAVPVELAVVPGDAHSIGILDAGLRERVAAFLHAQLG